MIERPYHKGDLVQQQLLFQSLRALPDGHYEVSVVPKARPSTAQRGYFHGLLIPLLAGLLTETQGETFGDDEAFEWWKQRERGREYTDPVTGEVRVIGRSTKGMRPVEFFEFSDKLIQFLHDGGVDVPPPDPNWRAQRATAMAMSTVPTGAE